MPPEVIKFLQKVAEYIKIATMELEEKEQQIYQFQKKAAAEDLEENIKEARYETVLDKAASSLYELDFITDKYERKNFLKKAKEDPSYLAQTLIKVCDASGITSVGGPARVTAVSKQAGYEDDPVAVKAFGLSKGQAALIDE